MFVYSQRSEQDLEQFIMETSLHADKVDVYHRIQYMLALGQEAGARRELDVRSLFIHSCFVAQLFCRSGTIIMMQAILFAA